MPVMVRTISMSATAKTWLSNTVRSLRERLLKDLGDAVESTYRMSLPLATCGLDEERLSRRRRLEGWLAEQVRSGGRAAKEGEKEARERHLKTAIKLAAATFLNRLIVLRQWEALGLTRVKAVTGGWNSGAYAEFREFAPTLLADESEGYATLLRLAFEELALDMPGLFGEVGVNALIPIPTATLRATVEALGPARPSGVPVGDGKLGLSQDEMADLWRDDTLLGWVYQFWNDPEREALDEKIRNRGKIENHEIAAKTQLFTDRYMVEWLLQNSLGQLWFAVCASNGWTPEVESDGTLANLEKRRVEWRGRRERGEVDLEALMPLETEAEERWKYWVPRELPVESGTFQAERRSPPSSRGEAALRARPTEVSAGTSAGGGAGASAGPEGLTSLRDLKLLDPACGSGHFLVIAFDLLVALYEEEARHRGESWSREQIACWIVENNLHGLDIDPRAVQIAAAALWLKVKVYAPKAEPRSMNLVASNLGLGSLPKDDPALLELENAVERETGIPAALTRRIVESLKGADYLGSLLKVGESIDAAIAEHEQKVGLLGNAPSQGDLFAGFAPNVFAVSAEEAKRTLLGRLGVFLSFHTGSADLGLRLRGEQLAAGVRFIRMVREGSYDLVVGNPPYQGTGKTSDFKYLDKHYSDGNKDLYSAFLLRGPELCKPGGLSSLLTLRGWMFLGSFEKLRNRLLTTYDLQMLGDLDRGGFEAILDEVVSVVMSIFRRAAPRGDVAVAQLPTPRDDTTRDARRTHRKRAALLAQVGRREFTPDHLSVVPGHPLIYWWDEAFLRAYQGAGLLGNEAPARKGLCTGDDRRFFLTWHEIPHGKLELSRIPTAKRSDKSWVPALKGAQGRIWFEPLSDVLKWKNSGLELRAFEYTSRGVRFQNVDFYFEPGIAFAAIGSSFSARAHRYLGVFGDKGPSVFPRDRNNVLCLLNSGRARRIMASLNPTVSFQVGDVNRVPLFPIESADQIVAQLDLAFTQHEQARETSVEFQKPGPSAWTYAQDWAQRSVDRPKGQPLPPYDPVYESETPLDHLSFALGVAMGRFFPAGEALEGGGSDVGVAGHARGGGILDQAPSSALPHGILFLSTSGGPDSLEHSAARPLHTAWETHGPSISKKQTLRDHLRESFFKDDHLKRYEKRPIYFPLTSAKKSFVAWCGIHRWTNDTLPTLLADHLQPELHRLAGELADLGAARASGDRAAQNKAQSRYDEVLALHQELSDFVATVAQIAERGAPPSDGKCPPREQDAKFAMNLDDGVMINSAALWPLLEPVWKDPKKWWSELCTAKGKDYDWAHLAARYLPTRVDAKCQQDPSLAVAHGCFWKYHPEKAYQWELRLQSPDELGPSFQLDEANSDTLRAQFETNHPDKVRELRQAEEKRRQRKADKSADDDDAENDQLELEDNEE
jgi:hypothetical protein